MNIDSTVQIKGFQTSNFEPSGISFSFWFYYYPVDNPQKYRLFFFKDSSKNSFKVFMNKLTFAPEISTQSEKFHGIFNFELDSFQWSFITFQLQNVTDPKSGSIVKFFYKLQYYFHCN
jgi:hypothetical protein